MSTSTTPTSADAETLSAALRHARDVMDREFADDALNLDRIAGAAFLSKSHFVRAFTARFGITPGRYLSARRIERAMDLLRSANLTVTEVCTLVGYSSLGSFSSSFSATVGCNPSDFQRQWRGRDQPRIPGCELMMRRLPIRTDSNSGEARENGPPLA